MTLNDESVLSSGLTLEGEYNKLHERRLILAQNAFFQHRPYVFGKDSAGKDYKSTHRLNGISRYPRGFVAQGFINHKDYGPLILTFVSHDPRNLGTYDDKQKAFVFSEKDLRSQMYLISALPPKAPNSMFEAALNAHFAKLEQYSTGLNLLGHTQYVRDPDDTEDRLMMIFASSHIGYAIKECSPNEGETKGKEQEYLVRSLMGNGRLDFSATTLTCLQREDMRNGRENPIHYFDHKSKIWTNTFPHTEAGMLRITEDWNWRISRLWNGQNLNPSIAFRIKASLKNAWARGAYRPLGNGILAASITELATNGYTLGKSILVSIGFVAISETINHLGAESAQKIQEISFGESDAKHEIHLKAQEHRDYAELLWDPKHIRSGRPAKKIRTDLGHQITRILAVDDVGATNLHLSYDDVIPLDPSVINPIDIALPNWPQEIFGSVTRIITPDAFTVRSQNGLITVYINEPPDDPVSGKSNITTRYTTRLKLENTPPEPPKGLAYLKGWLRGKYDSVAHALGLKDDVASNRVSFTPAYEEAAKLAEECIIKTVSNRREGKVTREVLSKEEGMDEMLKDLRLHRYESARASHDPNVIFYGLGKSKYAAMRLRRAFGLPPVKGGLAPAPTRAMT